MFFILLCALANVISSNADLQQLKQQPQNKVYNCILEVIQNNIFHDITVVNLKVDDLFTLLQYTTKHKIANRNFLSTDLKIANEAYVIAARDYNEFRNGMKDLIKDVFWNPGGTIVVIVFHMSTGEETQIFEDLHLLYAFKIILISNLNKSLYVYDFDIGDRCVFTPKAVTKYTCKNYMQNFNQTASELQMKLKDRDEPPYSGCNMKVLINVYDPYFIQTTTNEVKLDSLVGFEKLFAAAIQEISNNVTYIFCKECTIGWVLENYTITGALKQLRDGDIDLVLGGCTLSPNRIRFFDFTYYHICDNYIMIVPKASIINKWKVMFTVFNTTEWLLIAISFIVAWIFAIAFETYGRRNLHVSVTTFFNMFGYFVGNVPGITSRSKGVYLLITWALFTWLISCFYQSVLTSVFTKPKYYHQVDSFEEIIQLEYDFYMNRVPYMFIKNTKEFPVLTRERLLERAHVCPSLFSCIKEVANGGNKFLMNTKLSFRYYEPFFYDDDGESKLHVIKKSHSLMFITGYVRKGNPDLKRIRSLESNIVTSYIDSKVYNRLIYSKQIKRRFKSNSLKALKCNDIKGLYILYLTGCTMSFITFLVEIYYFQRKS